MNSAFRNLLLGAILAAGSASADVIIQEGFLSGYGEPHYQDFDLLQFDDHAGTRRLNFVQLDFLTSIRGGYQIAGTGAWVDIYARLDANYYLGDQLLAETQALIEDRVHDVGSPYAVTVYDMDSAQVLIDEPANLAPWIGDGQITLTAFTEFVVTEDPPDIIGFGAGGTVRYTATYDYDVIGPDCPGDLDGDRDIDLQDLAILLANYGTPSGATYDDGDIDADGDVDLADLSALLAVYGTTCD